MVIGSRNAAAMSKLRANRIMCLLVLTDYVGMETLIWDCDCGCAELASALGAGLCGKAGVR